MPLRLRSIQWTFPALISAVVIIAVVVFVWSGYVRLSSVVDAAAGNRMLSGARLVSGMLSTGYGATRTRLTALGARAESRAALTTGRVTVDASRQLAEASPDDSLMRGRWVIANSGEVRLRADGSPEGPIWASRAAASGGLDGRDLAISPLFDVRGEPLFEIVAPVRGARGADTATVLGYVVEARLARGRGVEQVRGLAGTRVLLVGQPGEGAWTDLTGVVPAPPLLTVEDSIVYFDSSSLGPGVGAAQPIAGTPWVVFLGLSRDEVRAPVHDWLRQVVPLAILLVLTTAAVAWLASRRITTRLVALARHMDALELAVPEPVAALHAGPDELGRLEGAFQHLIERARSHKRLEAQFLESQKLEAVGRLAGGIAHDFNNVLTVVSNYGEMVRADLPPDSVARRDIDEVLRAADRAARLTRQILTFSGRRVVEPRLLDLNAVLRDAQRMLERLIPERVRFVWDLDDAVGPVLIDHAQLEQVLVNLAVNAADAMPDGGELTIRTRSAALDDPPPDADSAPTRAPPMRERAHVCLSVRDTGVGMDRETVTHIFEPFFTTKESGKGTGLGLATVHGIITQAGGRIWVYSEPRHGTTFKIYLPEQVGTAEAIPQRPREVTPTGGVGTLLVVEDDGALREVTARLLRRAGYDALLASDAAEAVRILEREGARVRLVVSDVVMPGMSGVELAAVIAARWPRVPVVLMSGYNELTGTGEFPVGTLGILEKPFTMSALDAAIRRALGQAGG